MRTLLQIKESGQNPAHYITLNTVLKKQIKKILHVFFLKINKTGLRI
jgi:hypothetical protein